METVTLVIDVRSENEFTQGHIPGALNIPLLNNEERHIVGSLYKCKGFDEAFSTGIGMVGPKMRPFLNQLSEVADKKAPVCLYCARGGMRSQAMCWLFEQAGYCVKAFRGGYKYYRQIVLSSFEKPLPLKIVCGLTGTGKTDYLKELGLKGEQVIDLEGIAKHRGSAFGALKEQQPTQEQFENELYEQLQTLDLQKTIWVEDECRVIGKCVIPKELFEQMIKAPSTVLENGFEERIEKILKDY
nr:tRNA 2-selenouridine synthase [Chlamydiota bacterium]